MARYKISRPANHLTSEGELVYPQRNMFSFDALASLMTLTVMEVVLGIDNIVFMAILVAALPLHQQVRTRQVGLILALLFRLGLLFTISWIMGLDKPLISLLDTTISGKGLILLAGGMFLLMKATQEIYTQMEAASQHHSLPPKKGSYIRVLIQIIIMDMVFSLDSVITAVGMSSHLWAMVVAMTLAMFVMLVFASPITSFIQQHPSLKILALAFLILISVLLIAEGTGTHINKGYIYFAMAFSLGVELLNIRKRNYQKQTASP